MFVKIHKGLDSRTYQCQHIQVTHLKDGEGLSIELAPGPTLLLPDDGDVVYAMNDEGDTIDTHRWPPQSKQKEFRA